MEILIIDQEDGGINYSRIPQKYIQKYENENKELYKEQLKCQFLLAKVIHFVDSENDDILFDVKGFI